MIFTYITGKDKDMLSFLPTIMMCFLTKEYVFSACPVNLFKKAYHRITNKRDLKSHNSTVSLRWYVLLFGLGSDMLFIIDHLRSISNFCQKAHQYWLSKEDISFCFTMLFLVYLTVTDRETSRKSYRISFACKDHVWELNSPMICRW